MSIFDTFVAKRQTLTEFCEHREVSAKLIVEHFKHYDMVNAHMKTFYEYGMPCEAHPYGTLGDAIKSLDRMYWRKAFNHTGLMQILDATQRKEFDKQLQESPQVFCIKNVQDIFVSFFQAADEMFNRGVVTVFERLSSNYERHDSFKMTDRIILSGYIEPRFSRGLQLRTGWYSDSINDLDRVLKSLDGKRHNPRELENKMNDAFQNKAVFQDEYLTAKAFKNGNVHLTFKRADLVEKINLIIAKKYGAKVGYR